MHKQKLKLKKLHIIYAQETELQVAGFTSVYRSFRSYLESSITPL